MFYAFLSSVSGGSAAGAIVAIILICCCCYCVLPLCVVGILVISGVGLGATISGWFSGSQTSSVFVQTSNQTSNSSPPPPQPNPYNEEPTMPVYTDSSPNFEDVPPQYGE